MHFRNFCTCMGFAFSLLSHSLDTKASPCMVNNLWWYTEIELTSRSPAFRVHPAAWDELDDVLLQYKIHISTDNILLWVDRWSDVEWGWVAFVSIDPTHKLHARKRPRWVVHGGRGRFLCIGADALFRMRCVCTFNRMFSRPPFGWKYTKGQQEMASTGKYQKSCW